MRTSGTDRPSELVRRPEELYVFPERTLTSTEVRELLRSGSRAERCWIVSQLLRYAAWEEIWECVSREDVCELWLDLDLPESLREKLARVLQIG